METREQKQQTAVEDLPPMDEQENAPMPGTDALEQPGFTLLDENGNFEPEWYNKYESLGEYSKSLSKFKSPEALAKSYTQLERMKAYPGVEQADRMVAFRRMVGLPDSADEYSMARPEGVDEDLWNQALAEQMSKVAYEYGVPPQAMDALGKAYLEAQVQAYASMEEEKQRELKEAEEALQQEWGIHYEQGMRQAVSTVQRLAERAGVAPDSILEDPAIASNPGFIRIMKEAASLLEEAPLRRDDAMSPSPAQEAKRIESDPSHPLHEAYMNHQHPNHKYANEMYDRLAFGK